MVEDTIQEGMLASTTDRQRAILTKRERRYYLGEDVVEANSQAERSLRQNIRNRLTHALLDLSILAARMDRRDVDRVFRAEVTINEFSDESVPTGYLNDTITDTIALLFRHQGNPDMFAGTVADGLERAALIEGHDARAEVDIEFDLSESIDDIRDRLDSEGPEAVSAGELRTLREAGEIDPVEYHELQAERFEAIRNRDGGRIPPEEIDDEDMEPVDWTEEPWRALAEKAGHEFDENRDAEE